MDTFHKWRTQNHKILRAQYHNRPFSRYPIQIQPLYSHHVPKLAITFPNQLCRIPKPGTAFSDQPLGIFPSVWLWSKFFNKSYSKGHHNIFKSLPNSIKNTVHVSSVAPASNRALFLNVGHFCENMPKPAGLYPKLKRPLFTLIYIFTAKFQTNSTGYTLYCMWDL